MKDSYNLLSCELTCACRALLTNTNPKRDHQAIVHFQCCLYIDHWKYFSASVARMCYDSEASGRRVYIDTSGAKATENIPANVCQCFISIYNSKLLKINSTSPSSQCGSVLEFNRTHEMSMFSGKDCAAYTTTSALNWPADEMVISLHKEAAPYETEFCVSLDLGNVIFNFKFF